MTKHRIKVWIAADTSNICAIKLDVYLKKEVKKQIHDIGGGDLVTKKMLTPFVYKKHHVYLDNYFSLTKLLGH